MIEELNKCRGRAEKLTLKSLDPNNSINAMVVSGSKGSPANLVQIIAMLGQQELEGSRVPDYFYRRPLPHFYRDNLTPEAHGFIEKSYLAGLNPTEYWYHAQAGRVGIISKAIKTAETGYIQRKLIKAMEDLRICYDGTVRNANNVIIQTVYGNDGFDAHFHELQRIPFLNYSQARLNKEYKHLDNEDFKQILTDEAYQLYISHGKERAKKLLIEEFDQILDYYKYIKKEVFPHSLPEKVSCPVNFERIVKNVSYQFNLDKEVLADIDPVYIIEQVKELRQRIVIDATNQKINYISTIFFHTLLTTHLSSKNLIYRHKLSKLAFDHLVQTIYMSYLKVLVSPGEMVGIIAAQSIGEPATQMTLDTFHHTGLGSKANVSRGVPRLRELLSLTRNPKTPSLTVYIVDDYFDNHQSDSVKFNFSKAEEFKASIEYTTLKDLLVKTEIYYDKEDKHSCIQEDQEFIDSYYEILPQIINSNESTDTDVSPWLLRLEFNREAIMNQCVSMSFIEHKIREFLNNELGYLVENSSVIISDDNAHKLICRIKVSPNNIDGDPIDYLRKLEMRLLLLVIKGIQAIDKGHVRTLKKDIALPDGTIISPFDEEYESDSENYNNLKYLVDTNGSNLIDVLNLPEIDAYNTISNNVWEVYQVYGVEAARSCLIHEITEVLEYSGTAINDRNIELLVDVMTNQGGLVSVDRHGVNKTESGPLHRASFEETTAQITNASIFNETDPMTGVSGNIMFGQFVPAGTNSFRLSLDLDKIKTQKHTDQPILKTKTGVIEIVYLNDTIDMCNP